MAVEPKELMELWITTLDKLKTVLCSPAGSPTRKMAVSFCRSMRSVRRSSRSFPLSRTSTSSTRTAETVWEMLVAMPTPATPMPMPSTKKRFRMTLMMPAAT